MGRNALMSWCVHIATKRNKIATQHLKIATQRNSAITIFSTTHYYYQ